MEEMREIVDIKTVDTALKIGAVVWLLVCLLVGVAVGAIRQAWKTSLIRALSIGAIGPVVGVLWLFYSYMVRYDPETGYFGLDKVWVLIVNAAVFVLVGAGFGYLVRRVWALPEARPAEAEPEEGANQSTQSKPAGP
jgi:hypothetical protein